MRLHLHPVGRYATAIALLVCAALLPQSATASDLSNLVEQRLSIMKEVAAYKWQHKLPIENIDREQIVLDKAVDQGLRYQITTTSSRHFFSTQIAAAKEIQQYWFNRWKHTTKSLPANTLDLDKDLRPKLINLGEQISRGLASDHHSLHTPEVEGLSEDMQARLNAAAQAITIYPSRLDQILDSKLLRVGTTGDYAPFSFRPDSSDNSAPWSGIDIDLAKNLAASLGVQIKWVHTSWPTLMSDLHSGLYDIGMSGISINLTRQQHAFFSRPYQSGGKAPIIRCADSEKYTSLADIDKPDTRVIVNPGGTNHKFALTNIRQATLNLHNDNRSIFDEIVNGRADVMITDQIEVQLQASKHPELCAAMGDNTLTFSQKAFLLPQDIIWKMYVDTWLDMHRGDGTLEKLFSKHL